MEAMQSALKSIFTNPVFIPYIAVNSLHGIPCSYQSLSSQMGSVGAMVFRFVPFQTCQQHLRLGGYTVEPLLKYTPKKGHPVYIKDTLLCHNFAFLYSINLPQNEVLSLYRTLYQAPKESTLEELHCRLYVHQML